MDKRIRTGMKLLEMVQRRVSAILQSKEAKAFAQRVRKEVSKDKSRLTTGLKKKALGAIGECEQKLKDAKELLK